MRDKETQMLFPRTPRTSRLKPPNGIGAALALASRSAVAAGAPCRQASSRTNPTGLWTKKLLRPSIVRFASVAVSVADNLKVSRDESDRWLPNLKRDTMPKVEMIECDRVNLIRK
jgi:hypothetical protein